MERSQQYRAPKQRRRDCEAGHNGPLRPRAKPWLVAQQRNGVLDWVAFHENKLPISPTKKIILSQSFQVARGWSGWLAKTASGLSFRLVIVHPPVGRGAFAPRLKRRGFADFNEENLVALPVRDLLLGAKCLFVAAKSC